MKEQKYHIYLTNQERSEIIESLIDFKNLRMQQGKYTDAVDEVLVKVSRPEQKGNGNRTGKAGADQAGLSGLGLV